MLRLRRCCCSFASLFLITAAPLVGQSDRMAPALAPPIALPVARAELLARSPYSSPLRPAAPVTLPYMIRAAGPIFAGTVTAIARSPISSKDAVATVAITFHVNQGIQGTVTGQDFIIHQWIGLWNGGQQRYRIGEQVLLFLYPASKLGLTSWVSGSLGRFPIDNIGRVLFLPEHISAFRTDPVLGGKPGMSVQDFAWAVRRARAEEGVEERP